MTFLTQPQDTTVVEGGDATFQCAAEENGMALLFAWDYTPKGGMVTTVITGTTVAGVSMVTVNSDRTQLTLSGVQREVDGATVVCTALASTSAVESNPATITVQCRYMHAMVKCTTFTTSHYNIHCCCCSPLTCRPSCIQPPPKPAHYCIGRRRLHLFLWA